MFYIRVGMSVRVGVVVRGTRLDAGCRRAASSQSWLRALAHVGPTLEGKGVCRALCLSPTSPIATSSRAIFP
jgi:hypothetical protein